MRSGNTRTGFTLVELLVVIGIIAVLIGLLFPVFNKVRNAAKGTQCLANMRTIANGVANYEALYRGNLQIPGADHADPVGDIIFSNPNDVSPLATDICPAMLDYTDGDTYTAANGGIAFESYGWNQWVKWAGTTTQVVYTTYPSVGIKPGAIPDSSEVALYGDVMDTNSLGMKGGIALLDPYWTVDQTPGTTIPMTLCRPVFQGRHNGLGSVLWMDGHASLEAPVMIPGSAHVTVSNSLGGFPQPASFYITNHIGYLVRSASDLSTMGALYYYVYRKDALSTSTLGNYLDPYKALWK